VSATPVRPECAADHVIIHHALVFDGGATMCWRTEVPKPATSNRRDVAPLPMPIDGLREPQRVLSVQGGVSVSKDLAPGDAITVYVAKVPRTATFASKQGKVAKCWLKGTTPFSVVLDDEGVEWTRGWDGDHVRALAVAKSLYRVTHRDRSR
jgi:hypothetical protein